MSKWECTECSSNNTMPRDFGCDDCDQDGAMKGREYLCECEREGESDE